MSTLNVENIQHPSSSTPAISLDSNGAMTGSFPYPNRNLLYNGAMQVHQRGTSTTGITGTGYYTADRFNWGNSSLGTWTHTIENDAPTGSGFRKSFKALCTTADVSPSATNFVLFQQQLEGFDVQSIRKGTSNAQKLTLSFWVKSNTTGNYVIELDDVDNARGCHAYYSVDTSDSWEYKTITFPADTTGTFNNDNAASLRLNWWLGAGSNFTSGTLQEEWGTLTAANRYPGGTNLAAATNNYWQITGIQLETGPVATEFEFEPYGTTLAKCQRYYYLHQNVNTGAICNIAMYSSTEFNGTVQMPVAMRSTPSLVSTSGTNFYTLLRNNGSDPFDSLSVAWTSPTACLLFSVTNISGTAGHAGNLRCTGGSIAFNAEL